jgi:hypothetical protein
MNRLVDNLPGRGFSFLMNRTEQTGWGDNACDMFGKCPTRISAETPTILRFSWISFVTYRRMKTKESRVNAVSIATCYRVEGVRVPARVEIFLIPTSSRPALGPTQPPIQCVPATLSPGSKQPWREFDHSPPINRLPRSRKRGSIRPLPYTSNLPFTYRRISE